MTPCVRIGRGKEGERETVRGHGAFVGVEMNGCAASVRRTQFRACIELAKGASI